MEKLSSTRVPLSIIMSFLSCKDKFNLITISKKFFNNGISYIKIYNKTDLNLYQRELLKYCKNLKINNLPEKDALKSFKHLYGLFIDFSGKEITNSMDFLCFIISEISKCPNLTNLVIKLENNSITSLDISPLEMCNKLQHISINLGENSLNNDMIKGIEKLTNIISFELHMYKNNLVIRDTDILKQITKLQSLECLTLGLEEINFPNISNCFDDFETLPNLKSLTLYISDNNIGDKGLEIIINWVVKHSSLVNLTLDLENINIGIDEETNDDDTFYDTGGLCLGKISHLKNLKKLELFLNRNYITKKGISEISRISGCINLREFLLNLHNSNIEDCGINELEKILKIPNLHKLFLNLDFNNIEDKGFEKLITIFNTMEFLTELNLSVVGNYISYETLISTLSLKPMKFFILNCNSYTIYHFEILELVQELTDKHIEFKYNPYGYNINYNPYGYNINNITINEQYSEFYYLDSQSENNTILGLSSTITDVPDIDTISYISWGDNGSIITVPDNVWISHSD